MAKNRVKSSEGGGKLVKEEKTFDLKSMDLQLHFAQKLMGKAQKLEKSSFMGSCAKILNLGGTLDNTG